MKEKVEEILFELLENLCGYEGKKPLGGTSLSQDSGKTGKEIGSWFVKFLKEKKSSGKYEKQTTRAINSFTAYYSKKENYDRLISFWEEFQSAPDERKAEIIMKICVPELDTDEQTVFSGWKLENIKPNPKPYKPEEITIQLNALYSAPEEICSTVPKEITSLWHDLDAARMKHIADYDHPVPLFSKDENHELVNCLREMNEDIAFEKEQGVLAADYKVPVTISISVTHEELDSVATAWVEWLLKKDNHKHMTFKVLSESNVKKIREELLGGSCPVFSVFGKYAVHFNALKYSQLLLEKAYGIRAGFKLDTDEGMRSKDLHAASGKTWFQTLTHKYWGGTAIDTSGAEVYLGVNEGEYINSVDIDTHGYEKAYRLPEVKLPSSFINQQLLFFKGYAQGYVTKLYNTVNTVDECISHPVVKGGGYGIDNDALRKAAPFALSIVGRAEDQQYYFNGLSKGIRGIFHPDLRIAHYKMSVQTSETKQKGTKFQGDMYRLLIFAYLVQILGVKKDIDPFPGLFAGEMSYFQYFFNLMYQAFCFSVSGKDEISAYLIEQGLPELEDLIEHIESGSIRKLMEDEEKQWKDFVTTVDSLDEKKVKEVIDSIMI